VLGVIDAPDKAGLYDNSVRDGTINVKELNDLVEDVFANNRAAKSDHLRL
jgi:hypothetical protein